MTANLKLKCFNPVSILIFFSYFFNFNSSLYMKVIIVMIMPLLMQHNYDAVIIVVPSDPSLLRLYSRHFQM